MGKGITVCIEGPDRDKTARALADRVRELGRSVELLDASSLDRLGAAPVANHVCGLLTKHGVVVVAAYDGAQPEGDHLAFSVAPHDTPEFAAEKIVDALAQAQVVQVADLDYTAEDEEEIRQRLTHLGYIE